MSFQQNVHSSQVSSVSVTEPVVLLHEDTLATLGCGFLYRYDVSILSVNGGCGFLHCCVFSSPLHAVSHILHVPITAGNEITSRLSVA